MVWFVWVVVFVPGKIEIELDVSMIILKWDNSSRKVDCILLSKYCVKRVF